MGMLKGTVLVVGGVAAGMVIADVITEGAVRGAICDAWHGIKDKGEEVIEAAADVAADVAE